MSTDEKEAEALRLLEEVALARNNGRCDAILVRVIVDGAIVETLDKQITSSSRLDAS